MQPIRAALVSFGISSRTFHAPFLTTMPEYQLVSVVERSGETSKEKYPFVKVVRTIEDVLKDDAIELVVITSPNETHFPYAKMAMEAGKNVVLEKPFTNTSDEALELVRISKATGKVCAVYHNRRYVADYLTMKQILEKKLLGDLHEFEAHYDRYRPDPRTYGLWREKPIPGSGVFYDLGSHLLDQSLQLFGHPQYIIADIRKQKPYSVVDDYFDVRLDYGFLKVLVKSGMLVREMGPRYMMHGTKGSFIKYGEDTQEELLKAGQLPVGAEWGKEPESQFGLIHTDIDGKVIREVYPSVQGGFGGFYKNLAKTIREGAPLKEKPEHGYNVIRLIELAFESNEKQCRVKVAGLLDT
ncbi:MAG TPA: Gfo/Idh/MocA family oxidoreductase [Chitinophagaceae bacterium]|nr:Gfo/Idh/MocA family oxidoreductase [Chitinophagaceae bacterium]